MTTSCRRARPKHPEVSMTAPVRELLAALWGLPRFDARPPCAGNPVLFDLHRPGETPRGALERWQQAAEVCLGCPHMAQCSALVGTRVEGVVAGRVCGISGLTPQPPDVLEYVGPSQRGRARYRVLNSEIKRRARAANRRKAAARAAEAARAGAA